MNHIDGIVAAVPTANKEKYIEHCTPSAAIFKEYGALNMVECRDDDVPDGEITSFRWRSSARHTRPSAFLGSCGRRATSATPQWRN